MSQPWRLNWKTWFFLGSLALAVWFVIVRLGAFLEVTWVIFAATLISLAIRPAVDLAQRWHVPRSVAVLLIFALFAGLVVLAGYLLTPSVSAEISFLRSSGPQLVDQTFQTLKSIPLLQRLLPSGQTVPNLVIQEVRSWTDQFANIVTRIGELLVDLIVMVVLIYFISSDPEWADALLHYWIPPEHYAHTRRVAAGLRRRLSRWVWAQVALAAYLGVAYGVGLTLMGVPFAWTIALIGGALEIIPYFGGLVAVTLGVLSALTVRPILALWVILFHFVIAEIEAHVLAPMLFGRATRFHPAVLLFFLLLGLRLAGIIGVLFAVPLAVVVAAVLDAIQSGKVESRSGAGSEGEA